MPAPDTLKIHSDCSRAQLAAVECRRMDSQVIIGAFVRHLLTTLGGVLVSKGLIESSQVEPLAGALLVIGGVAWSLLQKKRAAK